MDVGGCFQNVDVNFEDLEFLVCLSGMRYRLNYRIAGDRRNICISAVSGPSQHIRQQFCMYRTVLLETSDRLCADMSSLLAISFCCQFHLCLPWK